MTIRYGVERYTGYFANGEPVYGVVDLSTGDWTRDAAGYVFQYSEVQACEVAKSLNAPRYVCACGYQVREDDREFHNSMVCPLTAPKTMDEDECPSCGAMVPLRDFGLHCCDYSDDPRPSDAW